MNCEHCKLPRDRLHDCMHSLMDEVARLKSVVAEFHNIDDVAEIRRLKAEILRSRRNGSVAEAFWL